MGLLSFLFGKKGGSRGREYDDERTAYIPTTPAPNAKETVEDSTMVIPPVKKRKDIHISDLNIQSTQEEKSDSDDLMDAISSAVQRKISNPSRSPSTIRPDVAPEKNVEPVRPYLADIPKADAAEDVDDATRPISIKKAKKEPEKVKPELDEDVKIAEPIAKTSEPEKPVEEAPAEPAAEVKTEEPAVEPETEAVEEAPVEEAVEETRVIDLSEKDEPETAEEDIQATRVIDLSKKDEPEAVEEEVKETRIIDLPSSIEPEPEEPAVEETTAEPEDEPVEVTEETEDAPAVEEEAAEATEAEAEPTPEETYETEDADEAEEAADGVIETVAEISEPELIDALTEAIQSEPKEDANSVYDIEDEIAEIEPELESTDNENDTDIDMIPDAPSFIPVWGTRMEDSEISHHASKPSMPSFDDESFRLVWKLKGTNKKRRLKVIAECTKGQPVFIICDSNGKNCVVITEDGEEIGRLSEQDTTVYHNMVAGTPHNMYIQKINSKEFQKLSVKILVIVRKKAPATL